MIRTTLAEVEPSRRIFPHHASRAPYHILRYFLYALPLIILITGLFSYYTDETAELVARHFQRDIEILGYRFDPG